MNRTELAERLGVSTATVSRICSGERRPSLELMQTIVDVMGWSLHDQVDELASDGGTDAYSIEFTHKMESMPCPTTSPSTSATSGPAEPAGSSSPSRLDVGTGNPAAPAASGKDG